MTIRYLKHEEIDKLKWDKCINRAFNGIVFAYSWYLDIVSYQWEALVMDDYDAVMPLTVNTSYSFSSIVQPKFTNQLGVFTAKLLGIKMVNEFLDAIPERFRKIELVLNPFNKVSHPKFSIKDEISYQLDLIAPYKSLYLKFSNGVKEKIKQSKVNKVQIIKQVNLKDLLLLKKNTSKDLVTFENLNILRRIIPFTISYNLGETFGAYNDKNELVAASFFIKSHQKSIQLITACTADGKAIFADIAIINSFFKMYSEHNITFDFGTDSCFESSIAASEFGATPVTYFHVKKRKWLSNFFLKNQKKGL